MPVLLAILIGVLRTVFSGTDDTAERYKLEGTWELTSMRIDGESRFDPALGITWTFAGNTLTAIGRMGADGDRAASASFQVKSGEDPKWLDFRIICGQSYVGIYKFEGPRLIVCYHAKDRPKKFVSDSGSKVVLMEFRKK